MRELGGAVAGAGRVWGTCGRTGGAHVGAGGDEPEAATVDGDVCCAVYMGIALCDVLRAERRSCMEWPERRRGAVGGRMALCCALCGAKALCCVRSEGAVLCCVRSEGAVLCCVRSEGAVLSCV